MLKALGMLVLVGGVLFAGAAGTGTVDQIRESRTLRIAYDPDAPPFSYIVPGSPANAEPLGYSVALCQAIAKRLQEQLNMPELKVAYVPVNSRNRFEAIAGGKADGPAVFGEACARCHGDRGVPPPEIVRSVGAKDLTRTELDRDHVVTQIRQGSSNKIMPAFVDVLTAEQIEAVADYVMSLSPP